MNHTKRAARELGEEENEFVPECLLTPSQALPLTEAPPAIVFRAGPEAQFAHDEFFARDNENTKVAYRHALSRFFEWCQLQGLELRVIRPGQISAYLLKLKKDGLADTSRKVHLAALRKYFDRLVERHAIILNPALSVRGPRVQRGRQWRNDEAAILDRLFCQGVCTPEEA